MMCETPWAAYALFLIVGVLLGILLQRHAANLDIPSRRGTDADDQATHRAMRLQSKRGYPTEEHDGR